MSVTGKINDELLKWSKTGLAPWQHDTLRRLLRKGVLNDADKADILERAQFDLKLATAPGKLPDVLLTAADLPVSLPTMGRLFVTAIKTLENVNAITANQSLTFGKHLTLIYGENGSGKSGYGRVMKKAARCQEKGIEEILPDVFQSTAGPKKAKCVFEIERKGVTQEITWQDGLPASDDLKRLAVFDSKCARAYVNTSNQLSFAPAVFDALEQLGKVTAEIKQKLLDIARSAAPAQPPVFQFMVENRTTAGRALAGISAATTSASIEAIAQWSGQDDVNLVAKEADPKTLQTTSPKVIREQLTRERRDLASVRAKLKLVSDAISETSLATLKQQVSDYATLEEAFQAAVKLAFGDSIIQGVGTPAWKSLIEAAASFSVTESYQGNPFPATVADAVCVLCQQPLSLDASSRLKRFWEFLQDAAAKKRDETKSKLDATQATLNALPQSLPPDIDALAEAFETQQPEFWKQVVEFFPIANDRIAAAKAAISSGAWESIPSFVDQALVLSEQFLVSIDERLKHVQDDATAQVQISKLATEIEEMKARQRLSQNLQPVLGHITGLKTSAKAQQAANSISTNALSIKARELHTAHVTDAFKKLVADELKQVGLRRTKVAIEEKSEKGKVLHSITVAGAKNLASPEAVFSEGERTAISLAFFLADLGSVEDTAAAIFDDPVTSLDHRIREGVINRLVAEAKNRQIIVFTHDLVFYSEMRAVAKVQQVDCVTHHIEAFASSIGKVSGPEPWDALSVGERMQKLDELVKQAKDADEASDSEKYRVAAAIFYARLRSTWERSVEELLFNKVVQRYDKAVKTMSLPGVAVDSDSITAIFHGMTRSSKIIEAHDHAVAANLPLPQLEEMKADLQALKDFAAAQKKKIKEADERHKHLKP